MKTLFFLFGLYGLVLVFGLNAAHAASPSPSSSSEECSGADCALVLNETETENLVRDIEALLAKIEQKISVERLHAVIRQMAEENPQIRELLEIVQQYGVLTEIELTEQTPEPAAE